MQAALEDVWRLVYELRPPALDELGLIGAIREAAQRFELDGSLHIVVETPESLPPLPAAVEVAAYRIALEALTEREAEILGLVAQGHSNIEIAEKLVLSGKTVRNHVSNIFSKLQVADRAHAIVKARDAGLGQQKTP